MFKLLKHPTINKPASTERIRKDLKLLALATNNTHTQTKQSEACEWLEKLSKSLKSLS